MKKYNILFLLAFLMLMVVSCQKGGEPVPCHEGSDVEFDGNSNQRLVGGDDSENENPESGDVNGNADDGTSSGGNTVIGGDDNEDDDDSDNAAGDDLGLGDGDGGDQRDRYA